MRCGFLWIGWSRENRVGILAMVYVSKSLKLFSGYLICICTLLMSPRWFSQLDPLSLS